MVLKGVLFVCFLWIGTLSAMPSNNDDGYDVPFRRNFQADREDTFSAGSPRYRKNVQSSHEPETSDPTARMDLVKSIDDILHSPYKGPYLESLQPLLQRQQSFIRPTRDSLSIRGDSSPTKRLTPFSDIDTDNDQFPQPNIQTKFNYNRPSTSSFNSQKSPSYSNFELQRPVRAPAREHERKPFDYSSQTFGSDSQSHFETIHDDFGASFEPVKSQRRPTKERYSNIERQPVTRQSSSGSQRHSESTNIYGDSFHSSGDQRRRQPTRPFSDSQRHSESTNIYGDSFHSSGDQRRHQPTRPFSDSQRYSAPEPFYSRPKIHSRNENDRITDPSGNSQGYLTFDRPFRPSTPLLSRRHTRNRRDLQSTQESQHYVQRSSGRPSGFPDFASIGGLRELQEGSALASASFNHNVVIPKVKIPDISVQQPMFREDFPFRKQVDVHNHRTTIQTPIFFTSKLMPDNIVESFHEHSVESPTRPDFSKLINSNLNRYSSPNARKPINFKTSSPTATSYASQSFSSSARVEPIYSKPILQTYKNSDNELAFNSNSNDIVNSNEPQSVFVAVSDDISLSPDKTDETKQNAAEPEESYQQFRPILLSPQKIEATDAISVSPVVEPSESYRPLRPIQSSPEILEKNNNPVSYESKTIITPGTLQANTNILALSPIKIEDTDAIVKSLQKFESQINTDVSSNQLAREAQANVGVNVYSPNQVSSQNEPIRESELQPNSQYRPEREIENISFKIHETKHKSNLNLKSESQPLDGHGEKSHFAVYGSSSSTSIESKPESFKVESIVNSKPFYNNHHHPKANVKQFEGNNKFIEVKPEFPRHPYIAQEEVPQSGFINVPRYHEYDLIPTYETEPEGRGVLKPLIDFVKKDNEALSKTIEKNDTNKTDPTFHESRVKKDLPLSQNLGDQLPSQSAQIPFHRIFGRKDANPESYVSHTRVPRQYIHYPVFDRRDPIFDRRDRAESINSPFTRENIFLNQRHLQALEEEKLLNQRFFPSFPDGRFFGPSPIPQPAVQVGNGVHRGRSSNKEFSKQRPFRASTKTSHNEFNDFEPVDNSILGSGNFEIIKGGTYYDSDDPHLNHNPYDPYLDNSYVVFPSGNPPSSNHVDDFFQNFRDFSEFATRRSDSNHFDESPNDGYIASGFSEHIPSIVSIYDDMMTSESKPDSSANSTSNYEIIRTSNIKNNANESLFDSGNEFSSETVDKSSFLKPKQLKKHLFKNKKDSKSKFAANKATQKRKQPKNIQDVLEQIDQNEQINDSNYDATDPLIAIF